MRVAYLNMTGPVSICPPKDSGKSVHPKEHVAEHNSQEDVTQSHLTQLGSTTGESVAKSLAIRVDRLVDSTLHTIVALRYNTWKV